MRTKMSVYVHFNMYTNQQQSITLLFFLKKLPLITFSPKIVIILAVYSAQKKHKSMGSLLFYCLVLITHTLA